MPDARTAGIVVFAVVVGLNGAGLALDGILAAHNLQTVTDFARKNQWLAGLIVLLNIVGLLGLAAHFSNGRQ